MTTDKDDILDLLRDEENFLNKRVMRNYDDAKKHLRIALTKDHMAEDVIYLAAKTYCDVYDMANDLGLIKNKFERKVLLCFLIRFTCCLWFRDLFLPGWRVCLPPQLSTNIPGWLLPVA